MSVCEVVDPELLHVNALVPPPWQRKGSCENPVLGAQQPGSVLGLLTCLRCVWGAGRDPLSAGTCHPWLFCVGSLGLGSGLWDSTGVAVYIAQAED